MPNERRLFSIQRFDIESSGALYLRRWSLQLPRGRSLKLHLMFRPDADSCLHDHPWPFWTFVLWGGYEERTPLGLALVRPLTLNYRPAEYRHTITRLLRGGRALTLVYTGPKERRWGFWTNRGWRHWREFVSRPDRALWCREDEEVAQ